MDAIEPEERKRLIEEAMRGRDNVIRYNLQSTSMYLLLWCIKECIVLCTFLVSLCNLAYCASSIISLFFVCYNKQSCFVILNSI
jgi:hypothetical protein